MILELMDIVIIDFEAQYAADFKRLNMEWLQQ
jgi:hypothetical protein